MKNSVSFTKREELRIWYLENHHTEGELWVVVSVKPTSNTIQYLDAVEEALCFGWIDSTKKKGTDGKVYQRFSPRRKGSKWTELNKERVRRLTRLGMMMPSGISILPNMSYESFEILPEIRECIESDTVLKESVERLPEVYLRIRLDTIQQVYSDRELFKKRLDKFVLFTKQNKLYGLWNDFGRLLETDTSF